MKEILDEIINKLREKYPDLDAQNMVHSSHAGYVYSIWLDGKHVCVLRYLFQDTVLQHYDGLSVSWKEDIVSCTKHFDIYNQSCFDDAINLIDSLIGKETNRTKGFF